MRVLSGLLLSVFAVTGPTACNDDNDKNTATLTVSTDALVLGGRGVRNLHHHYDRRVEGRPLGRRLHARQDRGHG